MKKKDRKKSWQIWQGHHLEYGNSDNDEPEKVILVTRTEHFFCGRLEKYFEARGISNGMCEAFKYWIKKYKRNKES